MGRYLQASHTHSLPPDPAHLRLLLCLPAARVLPHTWALLDRQGRHRGHACAQIGLAGHRAAWTSGGGKARSWAKPSSQSCQQTSPQKRFKSRVTNLGTKEEPKLAASSVAPWLPGAPPLGPPVCLSAHQGAPSQAGKGKKGEQGLLGCGYLINVFCYEDVGLAPNTALVHFTRMWVSRMNPKSTGSKYVHWRAKNSMRQPHQESSPPLPSSWRQRARQA